MKSSDFIKKINEAQSMGDALRNSLSRAEPGSKLDKKIRHHNDMVRRGAGGTMTSAPDGYHMDKKGMIRLGQGVAEGSREQVDPNTIWEVCFDYGPHQSDKVKVKASSQEEAEQKGMRAAKKLGHRFPQLNWAMPVEQGVAEGTEPTDDELFNTTPRIDRIRNRLEELHDTEEYEPEEVYDMVAAEYNMDVDELMDLLNDDSDLNEAEIAEPPAPDRKQSTATKQKSKFNYDPFQQQKDQPIAKADPLDDLKKNAGMGSNKPEVNIRKASQGATLKATSGITPTDDMANMLGKMKEISIDKDLEAYPTDKTTQELSVDVSTQNLPAVAGQALQAAGVQDPEFHQVANLPGNMADQIRQLGKSLFGALTMTPTKRIYVVANLGGQGPNTTQEVNAVANFLQKNGEDRGPGDIDFDQIMPGYKAQTHMYTAAGIRWMLVKDFAGQYIYCWPEDDSHDSTANIEHDEPKMKQLR